MLAPQVHNANAGPRKPHFARLYVQVLAAIALGLAFVYYYPEVGESLKPLGDAFIKLVEMIIASVIFLTIATGIAGMNDPQKVGPVAGKAMIYFLTFSSLALIVGLIVPNVVQPGAGLTIDPASLDGQAVKGYAANAHEQSVTGFLQVLFFSVLFGIALAMVGDTGKPVLSLLQALLAPVFKLVGILKKAAPVEGAGAKRSVVGLVVPTGYSFNLDGTNIYITLAALFIAQATHTDLSIGGRILLLLLALLPSKGTTRITGAGLVTLAATLFIVPTAPAAGMTLILGVDQFMSECRVLTIFLGNAVGTLVVARCKASRIKDDWQRPSRAGPSALALEGQVARRDEAVAAGQLTRTPLSYWGPLVGAKRNLPDGASIDSCGPPRLPILRELRGRLPKAMTNFFRQQASRCCPAVQC